MDFTPLPCYNLDINYMLVRFFDMASFKSRLWTFLLYPDSMPSDYKDIIIAFGRSVAISPLHDKDLTSDGQFKKPHFHCVMYNENAIGFNSVKRLTQRLNTVTPQVVYSSEGLLDYLTHENETNKFHYSKDEIEYINDFDSELFSTLTAFDNSRDLLGEALDMIDYLNVFEFSHLVDIFRCDSAMIYFIVKKSTFFNNLLRSRRFSMDKYSNIIEFDDFYEVG